jgi:lipopolysaccharide/colanic/teichoic acid biosynthesis glycosyltransferase
MVLKFVTMRSDSEWTGNKDITLRDDPRVLPVGRLLRKAKLNEVPQIINILIGDMSVVGWRPLMPKSFYNYYSDEIQQRIVRSKPGLTGIGSIVFRDEESLTERLDMPPDQVYRDVIGPYKGTLELWYQEHRSFMLDMKLVFLTAWVVLRPGSRLHENWLKDLPPRPAEMRDDHTPDGSGDEPEAAA